MLHNGLNYFIPLGGGDEIGASSYFLKIGKNHFLVDAGSRIHGDLLFPEFSAVSSVEKHLSLKDLDAIFLTHAHMDHIGSLPKVCYEAIGVPVFTTAPTKDLVAFQLLTTFDKDEDEDYDLSVIDYQLREEAVNRIQSVEWGKSLEFEHCSVTFFRAGHILGASMIYIESPAGNCLITGDYSDFPQFSAHPYELPDHIKVDFLVTESTYAYSSIRAESIEIQRVNFAQKLIAVLERGGKVLIPAFSTGRAQEISLVLNQLIESKKIPGFDIWIDGLAKSTCDLYEKHGVQIYNSYIHKAEPDFVFRPSLWQGVMIASSGMLLNGSKSARYAEKVLKDYKNALFFTGYMDDESPGKKLSQLKEKQYRSCLVNGKNILVEATIDEYRLSAHIDAKGISKLIEILKPADVVFVHGNRPFVGMEFNALRAIRANVLSKIKIHESINGQPIFF
jgi:Cft2 family RNA processing exonuclease